MNIIAEGLGKKFGREWIFRDFSYQFQTGKKYAITGRNGSGKSTLLKTLASAIPISVGQINYSTINGEEIAPEQIFRYLTYTAPYMELIEEFTLKELVSFYIKFKPLTLSIQDFILKLDFKSAENKAIHNFSSGMKQRLQLGLALFSKSEIVCLDEPTSNLDQTTSDWYVATVQEAIENRLLIISSNQKSEYNFCDEVISMDKYKY